MNEPEVVRLIREDMERAEQTMWDIFNQAFYRTERSLFASFYSQPPSRLKRLRWWWHRYLGGIWNALCGRGDDHDDYT